MSIPEENVIENPCLQRVALRVQDVGSDEYSHREKNPNKTKSANSFHPPLTDTYDNDSDLELDINPFKIKREEDGSEQKAEDSNSNHLSSSNGKFMTYEKGIHNSFSNDTDDPDNENEQERELSSNKQTNSVQGSKNDINVTNIQRDLEERVKILERREASLLKIVTDTNHTQSTQYPEPKNWPPFPKWTHLTPCFYQNISDDIPKLYQDIVTKTYYVWIVYTILLTCNMLLGMIYLFVRLNNKDEANDGKAFGFAILYFFLFIPTSYTSWFRVIYRACKTNSTVWFMTFFLISFFQCILGLFFTLGMDNAGFYGLINGTKQFTCDACTGKNFFVGSCMIALGIAFACCTAFQCYVTVKINRLYTKKETTSKSDIKSKHKSSSKVKDKQ